MRLIVLALIFVFCSFGCVQKKCDEGIPKTITSEKEAVEFFKTADAKKVYLVMVEPAPLAPKKKEAPDAEIQKIDIATVDVTAKAVAPEEKAALAKSISTPMVPKVIKEIKPVTSITISKKKGPVKIIKKPKKD